MTRWEIAKVIVAPLYWIGVILISTAAMSLIVATGFYLISEIARMIG